MSSAKWNRKLHRWGAILVAAPFLVVIGTGLLLQLKKEVGWIQPPTQRGVGEEPTIGFPAILEAVRGVPEVGVTGWESIERLDVQPDRGIVKVQCVGRWEVQVDTNTGEVLQVARRRSDLIESLHDGSFFHPAAKLWIFLPVGVVVAGMWGTGVYLWFLPYLAKRRRRREKAARRTPS